MIFPEPRKDRLHQKGIAFISTLVFALLGFVFLSISDLEIQRSSREVFRRIDMSSLMPVGLRLGQADATESGESSVQLISRNTERSGGSEISTDENGQDSEIDENGSDQTESRTNDRLADSEPSRNSNVISPPQQQIRPQSSRLNNNVPQESNLTSQNSTPRSSPSANTSVSNENGAGIPRLPLDSFGRDYKKLNVREIINWMNRNPSELPKGIRQLVRFRPAFLSSVESFTMDGNQYELYLMCKESLFEVHIVLVEQNEATYLVDRSFQKLSTYLRKGQVRRTQDNQIIAVRSNMASNDSSDEFYSLFLSWWEWARENQSE